MLYITYMFSFKRDFCRRLEDFTAEIRRLTEEKAALQAQCDMARAHLRALSGMLSSSRSQAGQGRRAAGL